MPPFHTGKSRSRALDQKVRLPSQKKRQVTSSLSDGEERHLEEITNKPREKQGKKDSTRNGVNENLQDTFSDSQENVKENNPPKGKI